MIRDDLTKGYRDEILKELNLREKELIQRFWEIGKPITMNDGSSDKYRPKKIFPQEIYFNELEELYEIFIKLKSQNSEYRKDRYISKYLFKVIHHTLKPSEGRYKLQRIIIKLIELRDGKKEYSNLFVFFKKFRSKPISIAYLRKIPELPDFTFPKEPYSKIVGIIETEKSRLGVFWSNLKNFFKIKK